MTPSEAVTTRFLDTSGDLLREVFEQFERENPEQAAELSRRVANGTPIAITVLYSRDGPLSVRVLAPADGGGTVEICAMSAVRRADH